MQIPSRPSQLLAKAQVVYNRDWYTKVSFKALFYDTRLRAALTRMSHAKVAPKGLKPQECERNVGRSRPLNPYIPEKDVIQEALESSANTLKLTLSYKVELCIPVWSKGTPELFLVHVQQAWMPSVRKASSRLMRRL
jgi:hypothetical protein